MSRKLNDWIQEARRSSRALKMLNFGLRRAIPFNRPHGICIHAMDEESVTAIIPYKRRNWNHIKGTHACGLATAGEFAAGLLLMGHLQADQYRLIMRSLKMTYHYQAKKDCLAKAQIKPAVIREQIVEPLKTVEKVYFICTTELHDADGQHVATAETEWQVKRWDKVRTKL